MRVVHLGFEDHRRPGAGGGSLRNHEVNRRLVADHAADVTVVTAAYPGCVDRCEDGVAYRHVGRRGTTPLSLLSYHAALPRVLVGLHRGGDVDLLVEEFAPPTSSLGVAAWSGLPTCANVQWYFAGAKAAEYRLPRRPAEAAERWGTRRHRHVVVVSDALGARIAEVNPRARITVAGMGLSVPDGPPGAVTARSSVFLGRLDVEQKGLDLLLEALALLPAGTTRLTIAGDGHGRAATEATVARLGLGDRVELVGRVDGDARWELLGRAAVVVMPSRRETYGLAALEALGCARPVVAFDIDCLRDVVTPERGVLVPAYDVAAFARAWAGLLDEPERADRLGRAGRCFARRQDWDAVAASQAAAYAAAADDRR